MALNLRENVPLSSYTTLRLGGSASFFTEARREEDIGEALAWAKARGVPVFVLGGGSNLLVSDNGFAGLVLKVGLQRGRETTIGTNEAFVTAPAAEGWEEFVLRCVAGSLAGVECLTGIPGTVGASPVQNIGAYGQEASQTLFSLRAYDRTTNEIVTLLNADCGFGYRRSIFNTTDKERYLILSVTFRLLPNGAPNISYRDVKAYFAGQSAPPTLAEVSRAVYEIRRGKGMVRQPEAQTGDADFNSAGSFFKNPVVSAPKAAEIGDSNPSLRPFPQPNGSVKLPAAWLIENAGFGKGYRRGNVGLSTKHPLALTNRGGGTAAEVLALMREIQAGVCGRFGVALHPEPVFLGFGEGEVLGPPCD